MQEEAKSNRRIVLTIDDDLFIRKMFHSMLEPKGFEVHSAENGVKGLNKALKILPDIIFLDIMMPEVDGFRTLEMLRQMEQTSTIPVIIVTARADTTTLLKAIKLGANDFIAKPFTRTMIMRKIRFALLPQEEKGEAEKSENKIVSDNQRTFIDSSAFRNMRRNYILKFDQIFLKTIRLLSAGSRPELQVLCHTIEKSCTTFDIQAPLPLIKKLNKAVSNHEWDHAISVLEELYAVFKNLQLSL